MRPRTRRARRATRRAALAGCALAVLAGACQGDWGMVGYDLQQTGFNPLESTLSPANVGALTQEWAAPVGPDIETAPVVADDVAVDGSVENLVFEGDSEGLVEAIDVATGEVVWRQQLGSQLGGSGNPGCQDSPFGINGGPVIDRNTNLLYVVDGDDELYALDLATGAVASGWPVAVSTDTAYEHVWSGITEVNGILYVAIASDCDNPPYQGRVVAVDTVTATVTATFDVEGTSGLSGGGIWGWGGPSADPSLSDLYVATGNSLGVDTNANYGDQVVELSLPGLGVVGSAPPDVPQGDNDFGGTPVLFTPTNCPPELAVENKTGVLNLYDQGQLDAGPVQQLQIADLSDYSFMGDPAWDPDLDTLFVANTAGTGAYTNGMVALTFGADCRATLDWQTTLGPVNAGVTPPVVADGVVYFGDGAGNTVYALDASTGAVLWSQDTGGAVFAPLAVTDGVLFVPSWDGSLHAYSLPAAVTS